MITLRKLLRLFCYYFIPAALGIYGIFYSMTASNRELTRWASDMGEHAWTLFWVTLFVSPLSVLLPGILGQLFQRVMTLRRELGVLITWLVVYHTFFLLVVVADLNQLFADMTDPSNTWSWGTLAGIAVVIMGITSNNFSIQLLRSMWKRVHILAYVVLLTGMLHVALVENEFGEFLTLFPIYLLLKWLAVVKQKQTAAPVVMHSR